MSKRTWFPVVIVIALSASGFAQTTTPTIKKLSGTMSITDPTQKLDSGTSISRGDATSAWSMTTFHFGNGDVSDIEVFSFATGDAKGDFSLDFGSNTSAKPFKAGTYTIDDTNDFFFTADHIDGVGFCSADSGTFSIGGFTIPDGTFESATGVSMTFNIVCNDGSPLTGSVNLSTITVTDGGGGTGGGSGGSADGGASGGTAAIGLPPPGFPGGPAFPVPTNPTTPGPADIAPTMTMSVSGLPVNGPVMITNLEQSVVTINVATSSTFASNTNLTAVSSPSGLALTLGTPAFANPGSGTTTLTIAGSPTTPVGTYRVDLRAAGGGILNRIAIPVVIVCDPPFILGTSQPRSTTVPVNQTATLSFTPGGPGPFTYQWYAGHRGSTAFPITGATSTSYTTGPITGPVDFWARATNPCGSVDSQTATVDVGH